MNPLPATGGTSLLVRLFPLRADNSYGGYHLGIWFFALVALLKAYVSLNAIFNGHTMAGSGDGIPVDTLAPAGAQAVVSLFAVWGIEHLVICLICLLVLVRYRSLIPFLFALLLVEHLSRTAIVHFLPLAKTGWRGESVGISPFPYGFLVLIVIGLVLSLCRRRENG